MNYSVIDSRANDITTIANGSMLEALRAFESQASRLMLSPHDREIVAFDHNPRSGPRTRLFGCEISNASMDVDPVYGLEESKQDLPSPRKDGYFEQLEVGDFQIADDQILFKEDEDINRKDLFPRGEIQTPCVQTDPATSSMPSESELRSVQIVEDTEDLLVLSCNPLKQEDQAVDVSSTPVRELPLKPSATAATQDKSLVQKTQNLCKSSGNSKAYSCSPEKKHTRKSKAIQKSKQNFNSTRPKDQKVDITLSCRVNALQLFLMAFI